ncbi:MAG: Gfo/Idh/MocA family oxidoreductase [Pirellulales bacterium]|nr:Gfo/Idh/MocA family oxidoreductase [Pirellulales bacterium]
MSERINRREMLHGTAVAGASIWLCGRSVGADAKSPNDKLDIAVIGPGGQGKINLNALAQQNIVAICDVDDQRAGKAYQRFPKAKKYYDYRRLFDEMESQIDAVVISTPDHTHFHPAMMAMRMGKHCYCEKPMAHNMTQVRAMTELAAEKKVATQLGVQRHVYPNMHRIVELIRSGAIGPVKECYAWVATDRGMPPMPTEFPAVPSHLKWDLWLGPAPERAYSPDTYAPYKWRFWWDFGTGEMGNWGCHILDIPYWALGLRYPNHVAASGPPVDAQRTPKSMDVRYEFPARGDQPPVTLHWLHTKKGPAVLAENNLSHPGSGVLFVGSEGMLLCDFKKRKLYPEKKFADFEPPPRSIPDSPGFHQEWINACKGGPPATCNFDYSGPLAETVTLGNVAYRVGHEFAWDAAQMQAPGSDDVQPWLSEPYREGWEI